MLIKYAEEDDLLTIATPQFRNCHLQMGADFMGMITCSSVDDLIQPTWAASEGASTYMADAGMNMWDEL